MINALTCAIKVYLRFAEGASSGATTNLIVAHATYNRGAAQHQEADHRLDQDDGHGQDEHGEADGGQVPAPGHQVEAGTHEIPQPRGSRRGSASSTSEATTTATTSAAAVAKNGANAGPQAVRATTTASRARMLTATAPAAQTTSARTPPRR